MTRPGCRASATRLGPGTIRVFCERWWARLPLPLTDADRAAGYWWDIVDAPGRGLPHHRVRRTPPRPGVLRGAVHRQPGHRPPGADADRSSAAGSRTRTGAGGYRTRLLRHPGIEVTLNAHFRHSRVKSYLKCGRALRIETVVNDTGDLGLPPRIWHIWTELSVKARDVNRRMVDAFRVGQGCVLASPAFERVARPTLVDGSEGPGPAVRRPSGHGPGRRPVRRRCTPSPGSPTGACAPR